MKIGGAKAEREEFADYVKRLSTDDVVNLAMFNVDLASLAFFFLHRSIVDSFRSKNPHFVELKEAFLSSLEKEKEADGLSMSALIVKVMIDGGGRKALKRAMEWEAREAREARRSGDDDVLLFEPKIRIDA